MNGVIEEEEKKLNEVTDEKSVHELEEKSNVDSVILKEDTQEKHEEKHKEHILVGEGFNQKKSKKTAVILCFLIMLIIGISVILFIQFRGKPIFQMIGESTIELEYGNEYVEHGVNAYTKFKNISNNVIIESDVDTSKVGTYHVAYKVPSKNGYDTYTRTVIVKDRKAPELTLEGGETVELDFGKEYVEPGFKATDEYDGDLTNNVVITKNQLENGSYDIYYVVTDSSSNKTEKVRHIKITDLTAPVIKLNGNSVVSVSTNGSYVDQGATATDNKDGDLTSKIVKEGNVDTSKDGKYTITYFVTDNNGNKSSVQRTVLVGESQATGVIYLTFDDGPSTKTTPKILDILKEKGVHATFFILNYSENNEFLVKREIDEGHAIGIHGYSHDYSIIYKSVDAIYENITKLQDKIYNTTGKKVMITRFPGGSSNTVSKKYCPGVMTAISEKILSEGFKYYDWNVASGDSGDVKTKEGVYNNVTKGIKPGRNNIILMHDFNGNNKTVEALPEIIDYGLQNGYRFEVITTDTEMIAQKIQN